MTPSSSLIHYHGLSPREVVAAEVCVLRMEAAITAAESTGGNGARAYRGETAEQVAARVAPHWRRQVAILSVAVAMYREGVEAGRLPQAIRQYHAHGSPA